jgi:hypothetical protein
MPVAGGPFIQKTGILLEVDAANNASYVSGSSVFTNVFRPGTYNGTINGPIGFNHDDSKGALTFPGTASSYVDFGNIGNLSVSWSFQVAVKPAPSASGNYTILSYASGSDTGSITYKLDYSSSNQSAVLSVFSSGSGAARAVHQVTGSVPTGSWSIINASFGGNLVALNINDRPAAYTPITGSTVGYNSSNRLYLGGTFGITSSYFTGSVGNFIAHNNDVLGPDLLKNYNAFSTRFGLKPSLFNTVISDVDAYNFIDVAGIVDATQQTAINNLVVSLKGAGLWTLLRAAYPLVGGTAYSHKVNLINPSTYPVLWNGGVIHTSLGVVGDGSGYGNTQFIPTALPQDSIHIGVYAQSGATSNGQHIGGIVRYSPITAWFDGLQWLGGLLYAHINNGNTGGGPSGITQSSRGAIILNRRDSGNVRGYVQGATAGTSGFVSTGVYTNVLIFGRSATTYSFAHIGEGLTDAQAISLQNIIQTFQTTLGRSI